MHTVGTQNCRKSFSYPLIHHPYRSSSPPFSLFLHPPHAIVPRRRLTPSLRSGGNERKRSDLITSGRRGGELDAIRRGRNAPAPACVSLSVRPGSSLHLSFRSRFPSTSPPLSLAPAPLYNESGQFTLPGSANRIAYKRLSGETLNRGPASQCCHEISRETLLKE